MKALKYKLKTNKKFVRACERTLDVCRELYNASIQERRDAWQINHVSISYALQSAQLPAIKAERQDVKDVYAQVLQDTIRRSDRAFSAFFRRVKAGETPGFPRFKGKDRYDSFTYPQDGFKVEGDKLHLSKIGSCRMRLSRPIEGKIKTCTIKRECDGWYVIFTVENDPLPPLPATGEFVGIDMGLESFATLSTGEQVENPRFLRQSEDALAKAQRKLSTKKRGSSKRRKQKKIVSQIHRKIQNQRKDHAHKLSNDLIERFDIIAVENLNVKGLQRSNLAKSISDASWSTFTGILSYKAEEAGRKIVFVDPKYTSQDCSRCGHRETKELSVRIHDCSRCGLVLHLDHNAAINILARAAPRLTIGISAYNAALGV